MKNSDNLIVQTQTMKKTVENKLKNQKVYLEDKYWRNLGINNFFNGLNNSENKNIKKIKSFQFQIQRKSIDLFLSFSILSI